jgi:HSP20 family protein
MDPIRRLTLRLLEGARTDISYHVANFQFAPPTWEPAINAYRCERGIRICVDLAGVDRKAIDLRVEPHSVVIRGNREVPEPKDPEGRPVEMLAMEIDYGPFERSVKLFDEVDIEKVHAEQKDGLLWIHLPFAS